MDSSYTQMVALIWNIADDVLRDVFLRGQYRDVILPMVVLHSLEDNARDILALDEQSQGFIKSLLN